MLKKAMIMAAGIGSRLEPVSNIVPKPLVPLANIPAMDILLSHLNSFDINNIVANTFYKSEEMKSHYETFNPEMNINLVKEEELSGTAGGLRKCKFFFESDEDFLVMSGDGLTDIDIEAAYKSHVNSGAIATIVLKEVAKEEVSKYGIVVRDDYGFIASFQEKPEIEEAKSRLANTGIYIFNYKIFDFIPENTFFDFAKNVFPLILSKNIKINTYEHKGYWSDIGSLPQYQKSNEDIINNKVKCINPVVEVSENGKYTAGKGTVISSECNIQGCCVIGNNCKISENTNIIDSILWDNVTVLPNVTVKNAIILPNTVLNKNIENQIISKAELKEYSAAAI